MPLLLLLALTVGNVPDAALPQLRARIGGLQGEWALIETADDRRVDRGSDHIRMRIGEGTVTLTFHGRETTRGTVSFGRETIDLKLRGHLDLVGVYRLDGDVLTICFDRTGRPRPGELAPTGSQWQEKWRRVPR